MIALFVPAHDASDFVNGHHLIGGQAVELLPYTARPTHFNIDLFGLAETEVQTFFAG